jgi:hypothetical protein
MSGKRLQIAIRVRHAFVTEEIPRGHDPRFQTFIARGIILGPGEHLAKWVLAQQERSNERQARGTKV